MAAYSVEVYSAQREAALVAAATTPAAAILPNPATPHNSGRIWMQGQQYHRNRDNGIETSGHKLHKTADLKRFGHHNSDRGKSAASQHSITYFMPCQLYTQPRRDGTP
jgi:hypothetical protein